MEVREEIISMHINSYQTTNTYTVNPGNGGFQLRKAGSGTCFRTQLFHTRVVVGVVVVVFSQGKRANRIRVSSIAGHGDVCLCFKVCCLFAVYAILVLLCLKCLFCFVFVSVHAKPRR